MCTQNPGIVGVTYEWLKYIENSGGRISFGQRIFCKGKQNNRSLYPWMLRVCTSDSKHLTFTSSVKNKLKCAETCWSKEILKSSFISLEKKKKQNKIITRRLWGQSLLLGKASCRVTWCFLMESIQMKPFLGRKKPEQMREGRQALN